MNISSSRSVGSSDKGKTMKGLNFAIELISDDMYRIDARITRKGKQYRKRESVQGKRNAERRATQIVRELEGLAEESSAPVVFNSFGECISYYKKHVSHDLKSTRSHMNMVEEHLTNASLDRLQFSYDLFIQRMRVDPSKVTKRVRTPATLNRYTDRVLAVLNFCKRKGVIDGNYRFEPTEFPESARIRIITQEEISRLMTAIHEFRPYLAPIVQYNLQVPSRRGELVSLRREWVDLDNECVLIPAKYLKSKRACVKPIPLDMLDYFKSIPKDSDFVFYRLDQGKYKTLGDFKKAWRYCKEKADIKDLHFHDGRHHSATTLIRENVSEREIMQVANWSSNMLSVYYNSSGIGAAQSVQKALASVQGRVQV